MRWNDLTEKQIQKARREGKLDNLEGEGKPLPYRKTGDIVFTAMGVMANAGVVPREIQLKKDMIVLQEKLRNTTNPAERKEIMRNLADLQMLLGIEQEARRKFYSTP